MNTRTTHLWAQAGFESARQLPTQGHGSHPSHQRHGHSFCARAQVNAAHCSADELTQALQEACLQLTYQDLNERLGADPNDQTILKWFQSQWEHDAPAQWSLRSAPHSRLYQHGEQWVCERRYDFQAAHQLPHVPKGHKCGRMHGHGFEVALGYALMAGESPHIVASAIDQAWTVVGAPLQWACLNEIEGLDNPTSEHLALWLWARLQAHAQPAGLVWVEVKETPTAGCHYDGRSMRIWKEQTFDAAIKLSNLANGDPRRQRHGQTYQVGLHLSGALDEVLGWVYDYGDVKAAFSPVFEQLDHQPLYAIDGLAHADAPTLAGWIYDAMTPQLNTLCRVDVSTRHQAGATVVADHTDHDL